MHKFNFCYIQKWLSASSQVQTSEYPNSSQKDNDNSISSVEKKTVWVTKGVLILILLTVKLSKGRPKKIQVMAMDGN